MKEWHAFRYKILDIVYLITEYISRLVSFKLQGWSRPEKSSPAYLLPHA